MKPVLRTTRVYSRDTPPEQQRTASNDEGPYPLTTKPVGPAYCPSCKAAFVAGRWTWDRKPEDAYEHVCPACQRIHDKFPAGVVTLKGEFFKQHRDEIVTFIKSTEVREKAEHPLQRIMAIEEVREGVQVTTTDSALARVIGETLHETYKGDLKLKYSRDENLLRAIWKR